MKLFVKNTNHNPRDPSVIFHNGLYYHCYSFANKIGISSAETIEGIDEAEVKVVFEADKEEYAHEIWAPE